MPAVKKWPLLLLVAAAVPFAWACARGVPSAVASRPNKSENYYSTGQVAKLCMGVKGARLNSVGITPSKKNAGHFILTFLWSSGDRRRAWC